MSVMKRPESRRWKSGEPWRRCPDICRPKAEGGTSESRLGGECWEVQRDGFVTLWEQHSALLARTQA